MLLRTGFATSLCLPLKPHRNQARAWGIRGISRHSLPYYAEQTAYSLAPPLLFMKSQMKKTPHLAS